MGGRRLNDISGQRFGMLTAVRPTDMRKSRTVVWECVCDCGNTAYVTLGHLRSGSTRSCGCIREQLKREKETGAQDEIREGMRFGRLTAVRRPGESMETDATAWECKCDCGNTVFAADTDLRKGRIESCGCLKRERAANRCLERNKDMVGMRFGRLTAIRPTGEIKFDSMVWECLCDCGNTTFVVQKSLKSGQTKSCGCLRREISYRSTVDLSLARRRFGKLVALNPTDETRNGSAVWECKCDCGNMTRVPRINLINKSITSCGCIRKSRKFRDLTDQHFGKLTVIGPTEERKRGLIVWECLCDCGNTVKLSRVQLTNLKNPSCGCEKVQNPSQQGKAIEGKRFGRLTAIRPTNERKNNSVVWECLCDCGNTVLENQVALSRGRTLSCGCIRKEQVQQKLDALTKENAGRRYGRLTILHAVTEDGNERVQYVCRCDCGNEVRANLQLLERGQVQSCGCLNKELGKQKIHDLTNQRFGYLTVIRRTEERRNRAVVWECKCDCGNTAFVIGSSLLRGNTKSCGCKGKRAPKEPRMDGIEG